jgi:hypothetical protein
MGLQIAFMTMITKIFGTSNAHCMNVGHARIKGGKVTRNGTNNVRNIKRESKKGRENVLGTMQALSHSNIAYHRKYFPRYSLCN